MNQEIHFVTGKGGVGKSVYAAALALKKSQEGQQVLLVELGDQSFFKDFFEIQVGFQPTQLKANLSVALWSGEACLREYARHLIKVESLVNLFFENSVMKAFINVAPGLPELAILGKATSNPRHHGPPMPFDCIVVDSFATGHFLALIGAPKGLAQAIQFGPMGEQSRGIDSCLRNSDLCHYHIITLPEELPIKETLELADRLRSDLAVEPKIIINRIIKNMDRRTLAAVKSNHSDLGKFASYLEHQLQHQSEVINKLQSAGLQLETLPQIYEAKSWPLTEMIAEQIR